jgi:hypothetical protein
MKWLLLSTNNCSAHIRSSFTISRQINLLETFFLYDDLSYGMLDLTALTQWHQSLSLAALGSWPFFSSMTGIAVLLEHLYLHACHGSLGGSPDLAAVTERPSETSTRSPTLWRADLTWDLWRRSIHLVPKYLKLIFKMKHDHSVCPSIHPPLRRWDEVQHGIRRYTRKLSSWTTTVKRLPILQVADQKTIVINLCVCVFFFFFLTHRRMFASHLTASLVGSLISPAGTWRHIIWHSPP